MLSPFRAKWSSILRTVSLIYVIFVIRVMMGATVMSGKVSGVCTRIQQIQPRALYHHCRGHVLNLVLSSFCRIVLDIRNLFCSVQKISWFLGGSAKRKSILKRYILGEDISELIVE
jgi:hypothetical protein